MALINGLARLVAVTVVAGGLASCQSRAVADLAQVGSSSAPRSRSHTAQPSPATDLDRLGLQTGMPYAAARDRVIQQGWQPLLAGDPPNLSNPPVAALFEQGYEEVKDCAGTGMGLCRFEFTQNGDQRLVISAAPAAGDSSNYQVWRWFIEAIAPNPAASVTETKPPFRGTRFYNFLGGTGTGQSLTLEADGTATVQLHGTESTEVLYRGPFTNPLILPDGDGLLIQGNQIYSLLASGDIAQGCGGEGGPCVADLYGPAAIAEGFYVLGGTGQGLEVSGDRYRYYDEMGTRAWQPLAQLTAIAEGLVFDGSQYWCLPALSGASDELAELPGVCTESGWVPLH
jgi:hypothetical protein